MDKKRFLEKYLVLIISGVCVVLFVALSFLLKGNDLGNGNNSSEYASIDLEDYVISSMVEEWALESKKDDYVLATIARTGCYYCQQFNPVFESVITDYNLSGYWFDTDLLETEDDYTVITNLYPISSKFQGTPFTMLTYNGELVDIISGYVDEDTLIEFLKDNNVIE